MATPITITAADVNKAAQEGKYFKFSIKNNAFVKSKVTLTGAPRMWKKDASFIYYPDNRVAGNAQVIQQVYRGALANSPFYSSANTQPGQPMALRYAAEILLIKQRKPQTTKVDNLTPAKITWILNNIDLGQVVKSDVKQGRFVAVGKPGKKVRAKAAPKQKKTLLDRLAGLKLGNVMDASGAKADGTNIRSIKQPGPNSRKIGVQITEAGNRMIVSDNEAGFVIALQQLGMAQQRGNQLLGIWKTMQAARLAPAVIPQQMGAIVSPIYTAAAVMPRAVSPIYTAAAVRPVSPVFAGTGLPMVPIARSPTIVGSPGVLLPQ